MTLGGDFEREILEQPQVWERLARSDAGLRLAGALEGDVVLIGSGSSLFAGALGALALRRRGVAAHALAATEARSDRNAYRHKTVVAISQSGRSSDVLAALDALEPARTIALTNTVDSPLGKRADVTIDVEAGLEKAIPATKSVTGTVAILLAAASSFDEHRTRTADDLLQATAQIGAYLEHERTRLEAPAAAIAARRDVMILGTDYGVPVAREAALKFKEATYMHAEGFEAGEFRHGSAAMLDGSSVLLGIVDADGKPVVERPMREAERSGALRYVVGTVDVDDIERLGPVVEDPYNVLAWLVTVQLLALYVSRARGIDSDTPRGLTKAIIQ